MEKSLNKKFDLHSEWRDDFSRQLNKLSEWLSLHELSDAAVSEKLLRLGQQVRSDKLIVAFVAEFSRGKSELINALFFSEFGRRIMPAGAGRTTMCPTEIGYEADFSPCLRLLPIKTRLQSSSITELKKDKLSWTEFSLDISNPEQMAKTLEKVSQVCLVSVDDARLMGFWHDDVPDANPMQDADGMVEVPMWRHGIVNFPHPLLKQGLVILDTPGLNAVGAEPELTLNLIPQAHAVIFILSADTGVTRSDLAMWREHLVPNSDSKDARWVVLNKIDTLWDSLSGIEHQNTQLEKQRTNAAQVLDIAVDRIVPVSAQKGLVGKIEHNNELLRASGIPVLENLLQQGVVGHRKLILQSAIFNGVSQLNSDVKRLINIRRRDFDDQLAELLSLRGKNALVVTSMRNRIAREKLEFERSALKVQAVRSVHLKMLGELFELVGGKRLKTELSDIIDVLQRGGLKLGLKNAYGETFSRLQEILKKSKEHASEMSEMLHGTFRQLNSEFTFSLQVPPIPEIGKASQDLERIENGHLQYLGIGNALKMTQKDFSERLLRALIVNLRAVFETVASDVELWSKSATAQLDAQLRERSRSFSRRIEAVDRILNAAGGLSEKILEIESNIEMLTALELKLHELTDPLVAVPDNK